MLHKLAWLQLVSEKRRLAAALAGIAFAVALQLAQLGFRDGLFESAILFHKHLIADLIMTSWQYENEVAPGSFSRRRLYQALGTPGVESVAALSLAPAQFKNIETGKEKVIVAVGFQPDQAVLDIPGVAEQAQLLKVPDVALFDALSRPEFGPIVGLFRQHQLVIAQISGRRTRITGLFDLGVSFAGNGHLLISDTTFRKMFNRDEGLFEYGLIRVAPGSDLLAIQADLIRQLPIDVRVRTRDELFAVEKAFWNDNTPIGFIVLLGAAVGVLVGVVIVYQILYTDVNDHLAEYATMKAMGYSDRHLYLVVLEEALILSVFGFPIGLGLAWLAYSATRAATHLPIDMTLQRASIVFGLTVVMCALSGMIAVRKLKSADPAEVF
jgi:putative ABC transport system permease protein